MSNIKMAMPPMAKVNMPSGIRLRRIVRSSSIDQCRESLPSIYDVRAISILGVIKLFQRNAMHSKHLMAMLIMCYQREKSYLESVENRDDEESSDDSYEVKMYHKFLLGILITFLDMYSFGTNHKSAGNTVTRDCLKGCLASMIFSMIQTKEDQSELEENQRSNHSSVIKLSREKLCIWPEAPKTVGAIKAIVNIDPIAVTKTLIELLLQKGKVDPNSKGNCIADVSEMIIEVLETIREKRQVLSKHHLKFITTVLIEAVPFVIFELETLHRIISEIDLIAVHFKPNRRRYLLAFAEKVKTEINAKCPAKEKEAMASLNQFVEHSLEHSIAGKMNYDDKMHNRLKTNLLAFSALAADDVIGCTKDIEVERPND
ncbi:hypothetical protein ACOME3_009404 [Neoechinorhynchus agilis]